MTLPPPDRPPVKLTGIVALGNGKGTLDPEGRGGLRVGVAVVTFDPCGLTENWTDTEVERIGGKARMTTEVIIPKVLGPPPRKAHQRSVLVSGSAVMNLPSALTRLMDKA